jgi:hypothetical protein
MSDSLDDALSNTSRWSTSTKSVLETLCSVLNTVRTEWDSLQESVRIAPTPGELAQEREREMYKLRGTEVSNR